MRLPDVQLAPLTETERRWFIALLVGLIAVAWLLLLLPGVREAADHGRLFEGQSLRAALPRLLPFVAVWTLMMWAMMLPSTLNTQEAVVRIAQRHGIGAWAPVLFSAGYLAVWSCFGIVAFVGDYGLHSLVEASGYLRRHEGLIAGGVVLLAGAYQFTPLKDACLKSCRSPLAFVLSRKRDGLSGLVLMGADHGLFCLGCCWALMLLMLALAAASLVLMVVMAIYFFVEKVVKNSEPVGRVTGLVLLSAGAALLVSAF